MALSRYFTRNIGCFSGNEPYGVRLIIYFPLSRISLRLYIITSISAMCAGRRVSCLLVLSQDALIQTALVLMLP